VREATLLKRWVANLAINSEIRDLRRDVGSRDVVKSCGFGWYGGEEFENFSNSLAVTGSMVFCSWPVCIGSVGRG